MILIARKLLTMQPGRPPIENGAVVVRDGLIQAAGPASRIIRDYPGLTRHHLPNAVLMPGLINLHTHLELPQLRQTTRAKTFPDWARNLIAAIRTMHRRDFERSAENNINELVRTGTTTVGEICTHRLSPALLIRSGLRSMVFHEMISMDQVKLLPRLYSRFQLLRILFLLRRNSELLINSISPHAVFTVSEPLLYRLKKIAERKNLLLAMHVAESPDEIRLLRREKSGFDSLYQAAGWDTSWAPSAESPFEYLSKIGFLGPGLLAVHAVQAGRNDIELMSRTRTSVVHCPRSNNEIGVGRMPLKKMLDAGVLVGLGTDSLASSPSLSMWDEMRYAYELHRSDGITPFDLFQMATWNGARVLRWEKEIGTLEPGKKADIIAVSHPGKRTGDLYSDLLEETESCMMSIVDGKKLRSDPGLGIQYPR